MANNSNYFNLKWLISAMLIPFVFGACGTETSSSIISLNPERYATNGECSAYEVQELIRSETETGQIKEITSYCNTHIYQVIEEAVTDSEEWKLYLHEGPKNAYYTCAFDSDGKLKNEQGKRVHAFVNGLLHSNSREVVVRFIFPNPPLFKPHLRVKLYHKDTVNGNEEIIDRLDTVFVNSVGFEYRKLVTKEGEYLIAYDFGLKKRDSSKYGSLENDSLNVGVLYDFF